MSYIEDRDYEVTIDSVVPTKSKVKGTLGLEFQLVHPEHGRIWHYLWFANTEKSKLSAAKTMQGFGISVDELKSKDFWSRIGPTLEGQKAYITTQLNEYDGKTSVKVQFINGMPRAKRAPIEGIENEIASMFEDLEGSPF